MIQEYQDVLRELVRFGARFLVVGAHALSAHGVPRATIDLDIWIGADEDNAARVYQALSAFGAPLDDLAITPADFTRPDVVTQFGLPPLRVDILTSVSGLDFESAWKARVHGEIEGIRVPILDRGSFIANKRASGRKKDLADLELLGDPEP